MAVCVLALPAQPMCDSLSGGTRSKDCRVATVCPSDQSAWAPLGVPADALACCASRQAAVKIAITLLAYVNRVRSNHNLLCRIFLPTMLPVL